MKISNERIYFYSAVAGVISILATLILVFLGFADKSREWVLIFYLSIYAVSILSYIVFMIGFRKLGMVEKNKWLFYSANIFVFATIIDSMITLTRFGRADPFDYYFSYASLIFYGLVGLVFGIGLWKLKNVLRNTAKTASVLIMLTSVSYVSVVFAWIGLLTIVPAYIAMTMLLFQQLHKL